ncbi:TR1, partial [Symbiodinium pilosum]
EDATAKAVDEAADAEGSESINKKIYLAGRLFNNRAELAAHVKKIQDSVATDEDGTKGELSNEDNLFIFHLLLHHPKAVEKMVKPISHFRYGIYDKFKNKCFISVGADGSQEGVSAAKSINVIYPQDGAGKSESSTGLVAEPKDKPQKEKKRAREEEKPHEPRAFEPQVMIPGCVMDINGLPSNTQYWRLKELLAGFGKVRFLQFLKQDAPAEPAKKKAKTQKAEAEEGAEEEEQEGDEEEEEEEERPMSARARFADPE